MLGSKNPPVPVFVYGNLYRAFVFSQKWTMFKKTKLSYGSSSSDELIQTHTAEINPACELYLCLRENE